MHKQHRYHSRGCRICVVWAACRWKKTIYSSQSLYYYRSHQKSSPRYIRGIYKLPIQHKSCNPNDIYVVCACLYRSFIF